MVSFSGFGCGFVVEITKGIRVPPEGHPRMWVTELHADAHSWVVLQVRVVAGGGGVV